MENQPDVQGCPSCRQLLLSGCSSCLPFVSSSLVILFPSVQFCHPDLLRIELNGLVVWMNCPVCLVVQAAWMTYLVILVAWTIGPVFLAVWTIVFF